MFIATSLMRRREAGGNKTRGAELGGNKSARECPGARESESRGTNECAREGSGRA
jgi:hypothetical protein